MKFEIQDKEQFDLVKDFDDMIVNFGQNADE